MAYVPPIIGTNDVVRIVYEMELDAQEMMMVLYLEPLTIVISDYLDAMEDLVDELSATLAGGGFWNPIKAVQSNELTYTAISAQRVHPTRDVKVSNDLALPGDDVDAAAPPNVAMSVTKRTLLATRRGVGRIQIPGLPVTKLDEGLWNETLTTNVSTIVNNSLIATLVTDGGNEWRWVLPQIGQVDGPFQPITSAFAHRTVRTMHRRTVGLGQ